MDNIDCLCQITGMYSNNSDSRDTALQVGAEDEKGKHMAADLTADINNWLFVKSSTTGHSERLERKIRLKLVDPNTLLDPDPSLFT